jgi:replicative DNA helicase
MTVIWCDEEDKKYPSELLQNREVVEGNLVACLWKDVEILEDHSEINEKMFLTVDGRQFFRISKRMQEEGYKVLDEISVQTFLQDKDFLKEYFASRGGYRSIKELINIVNIENIEKYLDELNKWNILLGLYDRGFNVTKELETKFKFMNSGQIYDYFDVLLNDLYIKKSVDTEISDFKVGIESHIKEMDKGASMGFSFKQSSPLLNYITSGVMDGFHVVAGLSGAGKTSFMIHTYLIPLIENGHNVLLLCNEQEKKDWWNMVLATILSSKFNYFFNRKRFLQGHFTDEEKEMLDKAIKWLKEQKGKVCFVKMFSYNLPEVKMILKKYSKMGYKICVYDTLKAETGGDNTNPLWQTLLNSSKEIFQTCSKEGIRMICTIQIAQRFANTRFLNNSCLSGSTQIIEVASSCILLRQAWDDEKDPDSKFFVNPYNYMKSGSGEYLKTKQYADINPDNKGMIAFISKNRAGDSDIELYYEHLPHVNRFYEKGFCCVSRTLY